MLYFPSLVRWLPFAFLLVAGRGWGQAVPKPLVQALHDFRPRPLADSSRSVALGDRGTVHLPPRAFPRHTGTKDSERGEVKLAGLLILYDIGPMAGTHISPHNRGGDPYSWGNPTPFSAYEERIVGPLQVTLGLRPNKEGVLQVAATVDSVPPSHIRDSPSFPANFWADVRTEAEIRQFITLVFSYRPVDKP